MEIQKRMTDDARQILASAIQAASLRHSPSLDGEHLLLGVLGSTAEPLTSILAGLDRDTLAAQLSAELGMIREESRPAPPTLTAQGKVVLEEAAKQAQAMGFRFVNGGHLLLGLYAVRSPLVQQILGQIPLESSQIIALTRQHSPPPQQSIPQIVLMDHRSKPRPQVAQIGNPYAPYMAAGLVGLLLYLWLFQSQIALGFSIILLGWIFSLTLHEFSHAIVAYWGGDYTVREKGYLSFNPLYYTDPIFSILLPLIFLMIGGIGLPGGAVYIEVHRLRSPMWRTAVALAGPASNAILAVLLSLPFILGFIEPTYESLFGAGANQLQGGLAFLIFLQVTAVFFNLMPIPPLDGFNAIAPFLPPEVENSLRQVGLIALFLIFYLFQIEGFSREFFQSVQNVTDTLNVPWNWIVDGYDILRFW